MNHQQRIQNMQPKYIVPYNNYNVSRIKDEKEVSQGAQSAGSYAQSAGSYAQISQIAKQMDFNTKEEASKRWLLEKRIENIETSMQDTINSQSAKIAYLEEANQKLNEKLEYIDGYFKRISHIEEAIEILNNMIYIVSKMVSK